MKRYSIEQKRLAVSRVLAGERLSSVARELGIDRERIFQWRAKVRLGGIEALRDPGRPSREELASRPASSAEVFDERVVGRRRIAELERKIGQQEADLDFFRQALRHVKARQQEATPRGALRSTKSSSR